MTRDDDPTKPLLHAQAGEVNGSNSSSKEQTVRELFTTPPIPLLFALALLFQFGAVLAGSASTAVIELAICARHAGELGQEGCKSVVVQQDLALIKGWQVTAEAIPSVLMTLFYGRLADTIGRVPVLRWSMVGMLGENVLIFVVCYFPRTFPTQLVWLGFLPMMFGGGLGVLNAMASTILTDVATEKTRSLAFSYITAGMACAVILGMPVASVLMDIDPFISMAIGMCLVFISTVGTYFLRETLTLEQADIPAEEHVAPDFEQRPLKERLRVAILTVTSGDYSFLWSSASIPLLMVAMLFSNTGRMADDSLSAQYAHVRFDWSWSQANYLMMIMMICTMLLLLVVLPTVNAVIDRTLKWTPLMRDIRLARVSILLFGAGTLILGLSATPAVMIMGLALCAFCYPFKILLRSVLASMVDKHHTAAMFSFISLADLLSLMVAGPALGQAFRTGLRLGGVWLGLPYFISTGLLCLTALGVFLARVPKESMRAGTESEEGLTAEA